MAHSGELKVSRFRSAHPPSPKLHYPFWFGGSASCFAAMVTHPLDLGMIESCCGSCSTTLIADFSNAVKVFLQLLLVSLFRRVIDPPVGGIGSTPNMRAR